MTECRIHISDTVNMVANIKLSLNCQFKKEQPYITAYE